jgi:uncharacterized protein (TIGR02646 family)
MIQVDRSAAPEPAVLQEPYASGEHTGKTELERVIEDFAAHRAAGGEDDKFSFPFGRYKEQPVKDALTGLFAGKCAYCETFYSASQPMDVEHWRPKGEVHRDDGTKIKPGYYWLAATWDNLLPSCIDCNRARTQHDVVEGREVRLGKANQFPLPQGTNHARAPEDDIAAESALLVNPCVDDPERFFEYTEEGVIRPRDSLSDDDRARSEASIRVYALNRSGLVAERLELIRRIDHRLALVSALKNLQDQLAADKPDLATVVEELISIELDALHATKLARAPFAGLARYLLRDP